MAIWDNLSFDPAEWYNDPTLGGIIDFAIFTTIFAMFWHMLLNLAFKGAFEKRMGSAWVEKYSNWGSVVFAFASSTMIMINGASLRAYAASGVIEFVFAIVIGIVAYNIAKNSGVGQGKSLLWGVGGFIVGGILGSIAFAAQTNNWHNSINSLLWVLILALALGGGMKTMLDSQKPEVQQRRERGVRSKRKAGEGAAEDAVTAANAAASTFNTMHKEFLRESARAHGLDERLGPLKSLRASLNPNRIMLKVPLSQETKDELNRWLQFLTGAMEFLREEVKVTAGLRKLIEDWGAQSRMVDPIIASFNEMMSKLPATEEGNALRERIGQLMAALPEAERGKQTLGAYLDSIRQDVAALERSNPDDLAKQMAFLAGLISTALSVKEQSDVDKLSGLSRETQSVLMHWTDHENSTLNSNTITYATSILEQYKQFYKSMKANAKQIGEQYAAIMTPAEEHIPTAGIPTEVAATGGRPIAATGSVMNAVDLLNTYGMEIEEQLDRAESAGQDKSAIQQDALTKLPGLAAKARSELTALFSDADAVWNKVKEKGAVTEDMQKNYTTWMNYLADFMEQLSAIETSLGERQADRAIGQLGTLIDNDAWPIIVGDAVKWLNLTKEWLENSAELSA